MTSKIIAVAIIKGGTGKTSTAAAIAQAGADDGKRVLAIDLDPQGNLTAALAADPDEMGSYDLLNGSPIRETIQKTLQGIDIIAASPDLATIKTKTGSAKRLRESLRPLNGKYDLIIIDTPPQMGELTFNALEAATGVIVPMETDSGSLQGFYQLTDIVDQIRRSNKSLSFAGIVICRYDGRSNINRYLRDTIKEKAQESGAQYLGEIRNGIAIREAQALQKSLYEYTPKSKPAQDYKEIYKKLMEDKDNGQ